VQALRKAQAAPGKPTANAPLMPPSVSQLGWLGLPASTVAVLAPHVTLLPVRTPVNLNTASGCAVGRHRRAGPAARKRSCRPANRATSAGQTDVTKVLGANMRGTTTLHAIASRYFEVRGRLRLGATMVDERSLVRARAPWPPPVARTWRI
jgi:general secretion pathway protein K